MSPIATSTAMMLFIENIDNGGGLELAMLLDESPASLYDACAQKGLEPWADGGALAKAVQEARTFGRASLFVVFKSDTPDSWGSRTVYAVAGGLLFHSARPQKPLHFEVVNRDLFGNVGGKVSSHQYRVLTHARLGCDLDSSPAEAARAGPHPHLGYQELQECGPTDADPKSNLSLPTQNPVELGDVVSFRTGTYVTCVTQSGYSEQWFVGDVVGLEEFRFEMYEYARRSFVRVVLGMLGFTNVEKEAHSFLSRDAAAGALLGGFLPQLYALERVCCSPLFRSEKRGTVKEEPVGQPQGDVDSREIEQNVLEHIQPGSKPDIESDSTSERQTENALMFRNTPRETARQSHGRLVPTEKSNGGLEEGRKYPQENDDVVILSD